MFSNGKIVKKTSDTEWTEVDEKYNFKWERNLNSISLPVKNIKVLTNFKTHDKDFDWDKNNKDQLEKLVTPDIKTSVWITADVDEEQMRDNIYVLAETDNEDEFKIVKPQGTFTVSLREGAAAQEDHQKLNPGTYHGNCIHMNYDPGEDDLIFELYMPEEQLRSIITRFKSDLNADMTVFADFASFTYEVDDGLREHYHSRDFVIDGSSRAFLNSVSLISNVGTHTVKSEKREDYEYDEALHVTEPKMTEEQIAHQQLLQVIANLQSPLKSVTSAIWVLTIAVIIAAFL